MIFAPSEQIPELAEPADSDDDYQMVEPPEPIENGVIDLGRLAADVIYLAIDPYPRKEGAVFASEVAAVRGCRWGEKRDAAARRDTPTLRVTACASWVGQPGRC